MIRIIKIIVLILFSLNFFKSTYADSVMELGMEVYKNKAITNVRKLITEGYIKINRESQNVSVIVEKANL